MHGDGLAAVMISDGQIVERHGETGWAFGLQTEAPRRDCSAEHAYGGRVLRCAIS